MDKNERVEICRKLFADYEIDESLIDRLDEMGYFDKPASTRFHGAYPGGLFDHCYQVAKELIRYTEGLGIEWQKKRSPALVGMLHDMCKCVQYHFDASDNKYYFATDRKGHGSLSVEVVKELVPDLTEEEELCIRYHMGAYNRTDWDGIDSSIRKYPAVLYTHTADMSASKVFDV